MQHASSSLISSTGTLSDEALAISIKSFLFHNLDNIFVSSFQRNVRIFIFVKVLDSFLEGLKIAKFEEFALARDQAGLTRIPDKAL